MTGEKKEWQDERWRDRYMVKWREGDGGKGKKTMLEKAQKAS